MRRLVRDPKNPELAMVNRREECGFVLLARISAS
jgi:hypothetical protein